LKRASKSSSGALNAAVKITVDTSAAHDRAGASWLGCMGFGEADHIAVYWNKTDAFDERKVLVCT
jgi:hypothetical protein